MSNERVVAVIFLAVSIASLVIQLTALGRLRRWPQNTRIYRGLLRTSFCRVLAASSYVALAVTAILGAMSTEGLAVVSLCVFSGTQLLWIGNAFFDVRLRQHLAHPLDRDIPT